MQIVIPMSGFGERFRRVGYDVPKPLIEIEGKPIIAHVIDMFPGELDFIFICNEEHLKSTEYFMSDILKKYCPTGRIVGIPPHKLGPVHAVYQVKNLIDITVPVIVNYCDFTCYWDWYHFKEFVFLSKCAGAIPAYKGFHPHSLGSTNYAYMKESNGWVEDIQEKQPFTENRMEEFASSGTYYFATGKIMSDAFDRMIEEDLKLGDEFYVSLAYKPLLMDNQKIAVYPLQHFIQWGTPEDVAEYNVISKAFERLLSKDYNQPAKSNGSMVIPMAGLGQRFINEGYSITKPLIPVSGKPMVTQAINDLPNSNYHVFVLRSDMAEYQVISDELKILYPGAVVKSIPNVTEGQACTAMLGLHALESEIGDVSGPVTFGACDNGALYDINEFNRLVNDTHVDVIVWGVRGHTNAVRYPEMFGWIDAKKNKIKNISVKEPLKSPETDAIVLGTFTFRRSQDFKRAVERLIKREGHVNGEYYIDSCINDAIDLGLNCHLFEVDSFLSWGTPNDLKTFEYWQSCFHKWDGHQYRLERDGRIEINALEKMNNKYKTIVPKFL